MTITRTQIVAWARERSLKVEAGRAATNRDFDIAMQILRKPPLLPAFSPTQFDNLVWNLGWLSACSTWRNIAPAQQIEFVEAVPGFLASLPPDTDYERDAVHMFWELVISRPEPHADEVREAMVGSLSTQLAMPRVWLQYSALHGFGHLKDPRCRPVIRNFLSTCGEPWLFEYAKQAMRFEVM